MEPFKQDFENIKTYALKVKQSSENLEKGLLKDVHEQIQIISELKEQLIQKEAEIKKNNEENSKIINKLKGLLIEKDCEIAKKDKEHNQTVAKLKGQLFEKGTEIARKDKEQSQVITKLNEQLAQKDTEWANKVEEQSQIISKLKEHLLQKDSEIAKKEEEHCQILTKVKGLLDQKQTEVALKDEEIKNLKAFMVKKDLKLNKFQTAIRQSRDLLEKCDDHSPTMASVSKLSEKLQKDKLMSPIKYLKGKKNDVPFEPSTTGVAGSDKNNSSLVLTMPDLNKKQNDNSLFIPTIAGLREEAVTACESGNWENFIELLQNNLNVSCAAYKQLQNIKTGRHILMSAAISGCLELISVILENGFPVNKIVGPLNKTLLHCAIINNHVCLVELLLSHGADMEVQTVDNWTALHYASSCGHLELVKLLISKGCNINALNKYNETALHCAAEKGHKDVIQNLIKNGCDKHVKNRWNKTALDLAVDYKQHCIVPILT